MLYICSHLNLEGNGLFIKGARLNLWDEKQRRLELCQSCGGFAHLWMGGWTPGAVKSLACLSQGPQGYASYFLTLSSKRLEDSGHQVHAALELGKPGPQREQWQLQSSIERLERRLSSSRLRLLFQRAQLWFPAPTGQFTTVCNSSPRAPFSSLCRYCMHTTHGHTSRKTPIHTKWKAS